LGYRVKSGR